MGVYVDSMCPCLQNRVWRYKESCHLFADTITELHDFASRLGLKRSWFQNKRVPHYDLTRNKRRQAIKLGAREREIDVKQFIELIIERRSENLK